MKRRANGLPYYEPIRIRGRAGFSALWIQGNDQSLLCTAAGEGRGRGARLVALGSSHQCGEYESAAENGLACCIYRSWSWSLGCFEVGDRGILARVSSRHCAEESFAATGRCGSQCTRKLELGRPGERTASSGDVFW